MNRLAGSVSLAIFAMAIGLQVVADEANSGDAKIGKVASGDSRKVKNPALEEMIVLGSRKANFTEITEDAQKLIVMPGALGDPLGAVTALPGVIAPSSGGAPSVRGSSPSDNRYYIDGIPAGYIFHEFNTSIFNENVVQDFQVFTAGFGAQYAGATGAVFDIRLRNPEIKSISTTIDASMLRAGVFVESSVTDESAFYLSARKGLIQYFVPEEDEADSDGVRIISAPEDADYQFKYVWDVSERDSLTISLAGASDFAEAEFSDLSDIVQANPDFEGVAKIDRHFDSQGVRWLHYTDSNSVIDLTFASFNDTEKFEWGDNYFLEINNGNNIGKLRYSTPVGSDHMFSSGVEYIANKYDYHAYLILFVCTEFDTNCQDGRRELVNDRRKLNVNEGSLFIADRWQLSPRLIIETGLQWHRNDFTKERFISPRIALDWDVSGGLTLTSSAGRYSRLPDIDKLMPTIGNPELKSERARHYTLGLKRDEGRWNWSIEGYYKELSHLPLGLSQAEPDSEMLYSNDVDGIASGIDLLLNKNTDGKWYGWVALSYSKSNRQNLRTGVTQEYTFDTPLVLNVVANYRITKRWNVGFRLTAKSGEATTDIVGIKDNPDFPGNYLPVYGEPYQDRLPNYFRLDLRAEREIDILGYNGKFYVDVLNALNRDNVIERNLDYKEVNETGKLSIEDANEIPAFVSIGFSITID